MSTTNRLEELKSYNILDTDPEKELDEISEIASLICDVPISLITILDNKRQWFKSKIGLNITETPIGDSFCQHTLHKPNEVLVVNDSHKDSRFEKNNLVLGDPKIRFYAGAPLETPNGNILGTLCVIDRKPREISDNQKKALKMLAKKAMDYMEWRKLLNRQNTAIEFNAMRLTKLTQNIPAGIFQLRVSPIGTMKFEFLSAGIKETHPTIDINKWLENPDTGFSLVHPEDIEGLKKTFMKSAQTKSKIYHEYRVKLNKTIKWHSVIAQPEKSADKEDTIFYGCITDITLHREYENTLEQMTFDISHVLRRPITSLIGLIDLINVKDHSISKELQEYVHHIKSVSNELDSFSRQLNETYHQKRMKYFPNSEEQN